MSGVLDIPVGRLVLAAGLAFLGMNLSACIKPKIVRFEVTPRQICEGQLVDISWQVKGDASLATQPALSGADKFLDPLPLSGRRSFKPGDSTTFQLSVRRGGREVYARQDVEVLNPGAVQTLVIRTRMADEDMLEAVETLPPDVWDPALRVDTVQIDPQTLDRTILVVHDGNEVMLSPDTPASIGLRGTRVAGCWELRARLKSGEVHGDPAHAPPDRLRIQVTLTCAAPR